MGIYIRVCVCELGICTLPYLGDMHSHEKGQKDQLIFTMYILYHK